MRVLVYGGTGSQSGPVVDELLNKGHTPVVVTRTMPDNPKENIEYVTANLSDRDRLMEINKDIDAVSFLLPAFLGDDDDAAAYGKNAIYAAVYGKVSRFIWNASGPIYDDPLEPKWEIFDYLKNSGLEYVVFEPTTYMENWLGPWTAPSVLNDDEVSYPVLDPVKMGWLASRDVGKLVVAAIEDGTVKNKRFDISGIETPIGVELAEKFSAALGRDIKYRAMTPAEMGAAIDAAFGPGSGDRIAEMYRHEQENPDEEPKFHDMTDVLKTFPVEMSTIEDWVRDHRAAFEKE
ncbi:SDR family oxidoreductase [Pseudemcibacter aquimaris]|uniref:SDR family oxidoreductase n=1 Tax=Pseudemcibacter aquimaris TaxID=2857064 RepID=UPI0020129761|nr:NmrA family NAD(P)-binding protein [Pseudemcibacter aquimaris]MCC3859893.1 NmrA family NAD(P)-binding protein [Pseudemcibacter aquimaris]WDU57225.1 NmrA family NAD(P)-binding protein [Pseudemcibacter aquimaris]